MMTAGKVGGQPSVGPTIEAAPYQFKCSDKSVAQMEKAVKAAQAAVKRSLPPIGQYINPLEKKEESSTEYKKSKKDRPKFDDQPKKEHLRPEEVPIQYSAASPEPHITFLNEEQPKEETRSSAGGLGPWIPIVQPPPKASELQKRDAAKVK